MPTPGRPAAAGTGPLPSRSLNKPLAFVVALLLVTGAVLGVVALVGGDEDGGDPPGAEPTTTTSLPASPTERDLLQRMARSEGRDQHVVLTTGGDEAESITLELWQAADGRLRQDLVLAGGGLRTETRTLQLADRDIFCQRATETGFTCQELPARTAPVDDPRGLVQTSAAALQVPTLTATDTQILGRAARCFGPSADPDPARTLCLADDGVPLRFGVQGRALTATVADGDVPDDVFDPPADPAPPPPTPSTTAG